MGTGRGRGRSSRGRGGQGTSNGAHGGRGNILCPVDFYLFASDQFPLRDCPAQQSPPKDPQALRRLTMNDRATLGDILCWFAATASLYEPSARLVMFQATNQDKTWLAEFAQHTLPQIMIDTVQLSPNNRCTQYSLNPHLVPAEAPPEVIAAAEEAAIASPPPPPPKLEPPPRPASEGPSPPTTDSSVKPEATTAAPQAEEPAASAAAEAPAAAGSAADSQVAAVEAVVDKAGEVAAQAAAQAKDVASDAAQKAQEVGDKAAAAIASSGESAQVNGVAAAAAAGEVEQWSSWFDPIWWQDAVRGESGPKVQALAIGGAVAAAVTVVGVVLGVVLGGKKRSR